MKVEKEICLNLNKIWQPKNGSTKELYMKLWIMLMSYLVFLTIQVLELLEKELKKWRKILLFSL